MRGSTETGFFHICTDGQAVPWIFKDDEDFIAGVNRIGICQFITDITVLCFILMDNHLHIILHGTRYKCKDFINNYKRLTGKWIGRKYNRQEFLKNLPVEIIPIENEESLLNTIAYIDRNSIVAGYRYMPREYPWGTARYMFRDCSYINDLPGVPLDSLTCRAKRTILRTRIQLPGDWKIDKRGMILPYSYIDVRRLEGFFKTPTRYSYFLAKKLEGEIEMGFNGDRKAFLPDKELREVTKRVAVELFGQESIHNLDIKSRLQIARKLRVDYLSTVKQISRMLSIDEERLKDFI